jgi:hypothetical protein
VPGASSLHNVGVPHGPDAATYRLALDGETAKPLKFGGGTAFMFETTHALKLTRFAAGESLRDAGYATCWQGLPRALAPHHVYAAGQPHAAGQYRRRAGTSASVQLPPSAELAGMRVHFGQ